MDILITGSRGMLGTELCKLFKGHNVITPARHELNIGNVDQVMKFKGKAEYIIHLSAETDHEYCEFNPSNAYYINTIGTANMVRLAQETRIPILYLSAGSIFDGKNRSPYRVNDIPHPVNHYNLSKFYGEMIVKDYFKGVVVRTGWLFGGGPKVDKKFVKKIMDKINRGDKEIKVCDDCIGSPAYTVDLAKAIKEFIVEDSSVGLFHLINHSEAGVSRYEFACEVVKCLNSAVIISPCKIDDLKEEFPCKRTNYEVLEPSFPVRSWKVALEEYIEENWKLGLDTMTQ